jgi:hypothetical protein
MLVRVVIAVVAAVIAIALLGAVSEAIGLPINSNLMLIFKFALQD